MPTKENEIFGIEFQSSIYLCSKLFWCFWSCFFLFSHSVEGQRLLKDAPELRGVDVNEKLGNKIPLDLIFQNEAGEKVRLEEAFKHEKPIIFTLAYYECPMLCTFVLNGLSKAINGLDWKPGEQYQLLTISIDPEETPSLARAKRDRYLQVVDPLGINKNWSFWVGKDPQIKKLADSLGFHYYYDEKQDEYAHPAVLFILTPQGKISRYLYGLEYSPSDLKLALLEASEGKIGNIIDRVILYCYHYDPAGKKYAVLASNVMRLGGWVTVFILGLFLAYWWSREARVRKAITPV